MQIVSGEDVLKLLDMKSCVCLMSETLASLSSGEASQPLRSAMRLDCGNILGVMPSYIRTKKITGAKVLSIFPNNYKNRLPSHQGVIIVFDTETGGIKAIVDAESITGIRTAAVSAVATNLLSKKDAGTLALLGAGFQANKHLEAILTVRNINNVRVWDINPETSGKFALNMSSRHNIPVTAFGSAKEAVEDADIICTLTPSKTPVLLREWVTDGAHINAVGACTPDAREMDSRLVMNSLLYVDSRESAIFESGDYQIPLREGVINENHILGELGDLILGNVKGRKDSKDITLFKALGLGVEDLAAADFVLSRM